MPHPPFNQLTSDEQTLPDESSEKFPLQDLPDELISRIFQHYVHLCDFQNTQSVTDEPTTSYKARALLSSINHRMRAIAIHTPRLWTNLQLPGYPYNYPPCPLFSLWIKRSGSLPIHLDCYGPGSLSGGHPGRCGSTRAIIKTIDLLRPHLHRWKSFKAFLEPSTAVAFSSLPLERAVSLNELAVVSSCSQSLNDALLNNIAKLSALQCLTWENYDLAADDVAPFCIAVTYFPWKQLVVIRLSVIMSPEETYRVLASSTSAEAIYLQIRQGPSFFTPSTSRTLVKLQNLRFLEIRADTSIYEVLQYFDFPGLKIFYISARRFGSGQPTITYQGYKDFISRASSSLEYVLLDSFDFFGDDVNNFFDNQDLFNIPVFQVWLDDEDSQNRAVNTLRKISRSYVPGTKRRIQMVSNVCFETYHVGWVDEQVKQYYHSHILDGYLPRLKYMLELDVLSSAAYKVPMHV